MAMVTIRALHSTDYGGLLLLEQFVGQTWLPEKSLNFGTHAVLSGVSSTNIPKLGQVFRLFANSSPQLWG
jgi:hypothetical protein